MLFPIVPGKRMCYNVIYESMPTKKRVFSISSTGKKSIMIAQDFTVPEADLRKLLGAASPDAALLYLFLRGGNSPENAEAVLHFGASRLSCASATLRQLGLWQEEKRVRIAPGERPSYTENDVISALEKDNSFASLYGEVQQILGRTLTNDELKILLSFVRYLGMSTDVVFMLVCYCRDRQRQRGSSRNPSLRSIEKEAYNWAEQGIDSMEEAAAYIQAQNVRHSRMHRLMELLQIRGRNLTPAEERYAQSWLDMGFEAGAVSMAYERTCLNTGGLNWAYMNKILQRWHQQGLHTVQAIQSGDRKNDSRTERRPLDADEAAAIKRMFQEG